MFKLVQPFLLQCFLSPQVDARTDVWAVGILIFHCLTGGLPFGQLGDRSLSSPSVICLQVIKKSQSQNLTERNILSLCSMETIVQQIRTARVPDIVEKSQRRASSHLRQVRY